LCSISHLQFAEDVGDVVAYRLETEHQSGCNVCVRLTLHNQVQYLAFAVGEIRKYWCGHYGWFGRGKEVDQALRNCRAKNRFSTPCR